MLLRRQTPWLSTFDRTSPFEELERLSRQMDLITEGLTRGMRGTSIAGVFPLTNVTEDKDNYYVRAELPGVKADELDINVTGDSLSISGERKFSLEDENARYHRRERESGRFNRIINLPGQLDPDKVDAHCKNGILTVTLPKAEAAKPKQIAVKTA